MTELLESLVINGKRLARDELHRAIGSDGCIIGFSSENSQSILNVTNAEEVRTSFYSAMVCGCLAKTTDEHLKGDVQRCMNYLLRQQHENGSFNYWEKSSMHYTEHPCPDDIDDTVLAVGALASHSAKELDGAFLAKITQVLIAAEQKPGGPYGTWLVTNNAGSSWRGIDLAVNANVSWMLNMLNIDLVELNRYLEEHITRGDYSSKYYVGVEPVWYFLSRSGVSVESKAVIAKALITNADAICESGSLLRISCALAALLHSDVRGVFVDKFVHAACTSVAVNGFAVEPLCLDMFRNGKQSFSGSGAVTAALLHEALEIYMSLQSESDKQVPEARQEYKDQLNVCIKQFAVSKPSLLSAQINGLLQALIAKDVNGEVQMMAYECSDMLPTEKQLPLEALVRLGFGAVLGWAAYSVFDDIMDESIKTELLPAALACTREMQLIFAGVKTDIFNAMDNASIYEFERQKSEEKFNFTMLADRSMGHALCVLSQLQYAGYDEQSLEFQSVQNWFREYIIAKQLHDDAHDWEKDLARGAMTYPVQLIWGKTNQKQYFLSAGMQVVASQIIQRLDAADRILLRASALHPAPLLRYSSVLRQGALRAKKQSYNVRLFMETIKCPSK